MGTIEVIMCWNCGALPRRDLCDESCGVCVQSESGRKREGVNMHIEYPKREDAGHSDTLRICSLPLFNCEHGGQFGATEVFDRVPVSIHVAEFSRASLLCVVGMGSTHELSQVV